MELEKAITLLKTKNEITKKQIENGDIFLYVETEKQEIKAIEKVLQELDKLQQKEKSRIIGNINATKIEDLDSVLRPYYIPKEIIEKEIEKLKETLIHYDKSNFLEQINLKRLEAKIEILQELLEEKE